MRRPPRFLLADTVEKVVLDADDTVIGQNLVPVSRSWRIVFASRDAIKDFFPQSPRRHLHSTFVDLTIRFRATYVASALDHATLRVLIQKTLPCLHVSSYQNW